MLLGMGSGVEASGGRGDPEGWRELNRANWDDRVPVHLASSFYDIDGFLAGADALLPFEGEEVGDVAGKHLVHLQCHIGLDTLSWARRGAVVSGLDFSSAAVKAARSLATSVGIPASFVEADVYDAVAAFGGQRFDIVYTGIGALVWLPSVTRWASVVASLLAPGGFLYLVEGHPFAQILDDSSGSMSRAITSIPLGMWKIIRLPTRTVRLCRIPLAWNSSMGSGRLSRH
jgi:SAM-dependent methyltransferase